MSPRNRQSCSSGAMVRGIGLSPGIAVGVAIRLERQGPPVFRLAIERPAVAEELERFQKALQISRRQLEEIRKQFESYLGTDHACIIDAHRMILEDPALIGQIEARIDRDLFSPERALRETAERWLEIYRSTGDSYFGQRGSDFEEVMERVISNLVELESSQPAEALPEDLILVSPTVSLSALADFQPQRIRGLVSTRGGDVSHLTIVARSCGIPYVGGVENVNRLIRTGQKLVVDGFEGTIHVEPSTEFESACRRKARASRRITPRPVDGEPVFTRDGRRVFFLANTEVGKDVARAIRHGAEGIGLFRSEYLYMARKSEPVSETEQFHVYRDLAEAVAPLPAYIRTLDIGDDGHPFFTRLTGEVEPILGVRGIRLSLLHPEIFRSQLRAIARASRFGNLKIVLPMVSSADEVIEARRLLGEVEAELLAEGESFQSPLELGAMLEVPAAVFSLEAIAAHSDFLLVGTNDLIQYTLAAGRSNQRVAHLFNPYHPAILGSLARIARVAEEKSIVTIVCGEVASIPLYALLLVGMGFQRLSMASYSIPQLRTIMREVGYAEVRRKIEALLAFDTVKEVQEFVRREFAALGGLRAGEELVVGG